MESQEKDVSYYLAVMRRYRTRIFAVGISIAVLASVVAITLPPLYRSSGTILIEQQEIPQEMVRSTITSFADQRIHVINQRVMTRANLTTIVDKYKLYPEERQDEPMEVVLGEMRDSIKMETVSADVVDPRNGRPTQATIAFTVSFDHESPVLAQKVANELVSLYLNENLKSRSESTTEASKFMTDEVNKHMDHMADIEKKLAQFKERNANQLPDLLQLNVQLIERTERDLFDAQMQLRTLRERKAYMESQLTLLARDSTVYTETGERIMGPADRLKQLQIKYLSMVSVYGDQHPDLVRTRKEIEALKKETQGEVINESNDLRISQAKVSEQLSQAREKYAANHPEIKRLERQLDSLTQALVVQRATVQPETADAGVASNPSYVQFKSQLESATVELVMAEKRETQLRQKLAEHERHMLKMPQVEREYRELLRDYENSSVSYKQMKAKQTEAQLAQVMESERKGERFTLVEPPELSEKPLKPNRMAILVLGLVFALAGGVGTALVSASFDKAVYGNSALAAATGMRPLVAIPFIETVAEINAYTRRKYLALAGMFAMLVVGLITIHLFYKPLDVLWFVMQRRMGMA
jgi:succinoglycan biosynthesis transport protein ExoP